MAWGEKGQSRKTLRIAAVGRDGSGRAWRAIQRAHLENYKRGSVDRICSLL